MNSLIAVFIGGGLGSMARFGISEMVKGNFKNSFPIATLLVNILSCIILGLFFFYVTERTSVSMKNLIIAGFCGGFSTFSTFSYETVLILKSGNWLFAIINILLNVIFCISIVYLLYRHA